MSVSRSPKNPIIQPKDVKPSSSDFEVIGVFNAGVTRFKDQILLLLRVAERPISTHPDIVLAGVYDVAKGAILLKEFSKNDPHNDFSDPRLIIRPAETYLTSISHLRLARSTDGISFQIEDTPAITPANEYETFGVEDPRITVIGDTYYITYVAVSPVGITTALASTKDFKSFARHGLIFPPENKDVLLFPGKINGRFYAMHRPVSPLFKKQEIWLAESPDLTSWGNHRYLMSPRPELWDEEKIGASVVPFKTDQGWLEVYHGADRNNRYCLGAVLLDDNQPWKVIARSKQPILEPQAPYEIEGFFGNVVFSCGMLFEDEKLKIYYGVADTAVCYAELTLKDVLDNLSL
ncbi:MAG: glycoside hydrolase family 130 protein [Planctomycetota bacterium]|nr:MAG: glycoside hydrolase family 130 protein [Planctomycetota bacterium]